MRLDRFRAQGVHGYLSLDLKFKKDLTFLTGINGGGKTTALNAIVALITPDLSTLSNLRYSSLSVDLSHEGQKLTISATSDEDAFILSVTGASDSLKLRRYIVDMDGGGARRAELEAEYFRDLVNSHAPHPVMRLIARLPTPMFLGLDRRARFDVDDRRRVYAPARPGRVGRNVFSVALSRSLGDAADLAATSNRDALISSARIGDELRRDMLLDLLTTSPEDYGNLTVPSRSEIQEIEQLRRDLETFPQIFNLPRDDVQRRIVPFLDVVQAAAESIPENSNIETLLKNTRINTDELQSLVKWSTNRPQLKRIRVISEVVKRFNDRRTLLLQPVQRYTKLVNAFLKDSGKSIAFDKDGYVYVSIEGVDEPKEIASLSSGEAQIFVILTHLSFNRNAQAANVFIIDEPELSLHVFWQELFVDSVMSANPKIQYIMATHAPSIILDRTKNCVDLTRRGGR